jgi:hypothetical protein
MAERTSRKTSFEEAYAGFAALTYEWAKEIADENRRQRGELVDEDRPRKVNRSVGSTRSHKRVPVK